MDVPFARPGPETVRDVCAACPYVRATASGGEVEVGSVGLEKRPASIP